jgi:hypothetical protein
MENEELIISVLEGQGLDQKQIADIMAELSQVDFGALDPTTPVRDLPKFENELKSQMDSQTDWRNKARLAARIISLNLE